MSEFSYAYDASGRIAAEDSTLAGDDGLQHASHLEFAYTPAGKLASCGGERDGKAFSERYAYDAKGNKVSMERTGDGAESVTYAYDAADRLLREDSSTRGAIEYAYDADGQLVGKSGGGHDYAYAYGVEGRLQAVRDGGLLLMSAAYDGDGKLVAEETLYQSFPLTIGVPAETAVLP